jgi:hypothetical protein
MATVRVEYESEAATVIEVTRDLRCNDQPLNMFYEMLRWQIHKVELTIHTDDVEMIPFYKLIKGLYHMRILHIITPTKLDLTPFMPYFPEPPVVHLEWQNCQQFNRYLQVHESLQVLIFSGEYRGEQLNLDGVSPRCLELWNCPPADLEHLLMKSEDHCVTLRLRAGEDYNARFIFGYNKTIERPMKLEHVVFDSFDVCVTSLLKMTLQRMITLTTLTMIIGGRYTRLDQEAITLIRCHPSLTMIRGPWLGVERMLRKKVNATKIIFLLSAFEKPNVECVFTKLFPVDLLRLVYYTLYKND